MVDTCTVGVILSTRWMITFSRCQPIYATLFGDLNFLQTKTCLDSWSISSSGQWRLTSSVPANFVFSQAASLPLWLLYSTVVQYSALQYSTVQYNTVQYNTLHFLTVQYSKVLYRSVRYSTRQSLSPLSPESPPQVKWQQARPSFALHLQAAETF